MTDGDSPTTIGDVPADDADDAETPGGEAKPGDATDDAEIDGDAADADEEPKEDVKP